MSSTVRISDTLHTQARLAQGLELWRIEGTDPRDLISRILGELKRAEAMLCAEKKEAHQIFGALKKPYRRRV